MFEDGRSEQHLIRPAENWTDWSDQAEAIHHIPRARLVADGAPHLTVAQRMIEALMGHDLFASAPSWDGKWLSTLLRAAGLPRQSLRLAATEDAQHKTVSHILERVVAPHDLAAQTQMLIARVNSEERNVAPAHRALADAEDEWRRWRAARDAALAYVGSFAG